MKALSAILPVSDQPVGEELKKTVNARRLHVWLGVGKDFSNWIKDRIDKIGFVENEDFIKIAARQNERAGNRGASIEYHITTDMAKHLAMVEKNEKGREARQYFIAIEKQANAPKTLRQKYDEILTSAIHYRETARRQEDLMEMAMPINLHLYGTCDENGNEYKGIRRATITRSISRIRAAAEFHLKACQLEMLQLLEAAK